MIKKEYLLIPGPTQVPVNVSLAMAMPMINHRGAEFSAMFKEITEGLQWAFQTKNDVLVLTSSGTGGMEAAIANTLSAGDKVLVINIGAFGSRFVKISKAYGADVDEIKVERGKAVNVSVVLDKLKADKDKKIKAVLFQHNETSTGVLNDVKAICEAVAEHGALSIVDSISGLLTAPLKTDEWGIDIAIAGSQKAFMIPPGLAFVSVSKKAYEAYKTSKMPKFYFDFADAKKFLEKWQNPATPPVSILYGLYESLKMLRAEGLDTTFLRHEKLAAAVRSGVKALGFSLLAADSVASKGVTAVIPPAGVDAEAVRKDVKKEYGVVLAGGQEDLKGKIFRIGHLGYVDRLEIIGAFAALEMTMKKLGIKIELGKSVAAVQEALL